MPSRIGDRSQERSPSSQLYVRSTNRTDDALGTSSPPDLSRAQATKSDQGRDARAPARVTVERGVSSRDCTHRRYLPRQRLWRHQDPMANCIRREFHLKGGPRAEVRTRTRCKPSIPRLTFVLGGQDRSTAAAPPTVRCLSLQCVTDSCTSTPAQLAVCHRTGLCGGLEAAP